MGRQKRIDRAQLVAICAEAREAGLSVHRTVAEVMDLTPAQTNYYIRQAREDGLLPPGRSGEVHAMVTATINRGTPRERRWLVCQVCLTADCAVAEGRAAS